MLISKDFSYTLLDPKDLKAFTGLSTSTIIQRQSIPISVDWSVIRWHLEGMYGEVEDGQDSEGRPSFTVMNAVQLTRLSETAAELSWTSTTSNDMIADSCLAILFGIDSSPATVKLTSAPHPHSHSHSHSHAHSGSHGHDGQAESGPPRTKPRKKPGQVKMEGSKPVVPADFERLHMFLSSHFGDVSEPQIALDGEDEDDLMVIDVRVDGRLARVDLISMKVECESDELRRSVEEVVELAMSTMRPLSRTFLGSGVGSEGIKAEQAVVA